MRSFAQKHNQHQEPLSSSSVRLAVQRMLQTLTEERDDELIAAPSPQFRHDFSKIPVHHQAPGAIQTKLAINKPGDEYEKEADRMATDQVMRMPLLAVPFAAAFSNMSCPAASGLLSQGAREGTCSDCLEKEPKPQSEELQRKASTLPATASPSSAAAPPIVHQVVRSAGRPLDASALAFFETRFGHDFSRVRVHSDAIAEQSTREVNAHAYTVGADIVFGAGRFAPETREGRKLIAHELTHVVQQSAAGGGGEIRSGHGIVQREADEGEETESPLEPVEDWVAWLDRANAAADAAKDGSEALAELRATESALAEEFGARELGASTLLGPLQMGLGIHGTVEGIKRGGEKGIKQAITGTADFFSGGATTLAPVIGGAATTVAAPLAAFTTGMAVGDAGLTESPYDHPGWAADLGRTFDRSGIPGAGFAGTLIGSAIQTPAVAYYGAKRVAKSLMSPVMPEVLEIAQGQSQARAPRLDLPPAPEQIGPTTQVAHETMPPVTFSPSQLRGIRQKLLKSIAQLMMSVKPGSKPKGKSKRRRSER